MRTAARAALPAAVLFALNAWIVWRLFSLDYGDHFASIDGFFVAIARYLPRHWGDHQWWPLWHGGMPFQYVYVPLLHLTTSAYATISGVDAARAYHAVTAFFYCCGPPALYALGLRLGANRGAAFLAALCYSLFSPCGLVMPLMRQDMGGLWYARRLQVMVAYGEGPHVAAMTLAPIALLAIDRSAALKTSRAFALAGIALALVFLTNIPGSMGLALAVFCWLAVQPSGLRGRAWRISALAAVFGYALACYGNPPSSMLTIFQNIGPMQQGFSASLKMGPLLFGLALAATAGLGWALTRPQLRLPLYMRFGLLYAALLELIVETARSDVFELLPQAGRLHTEFEMGACLVIGGGLWAIYCLIPKSVRPVIALACLWPLWLQVSNYRWWARTFIKPIDISKRSEYASARWLDANARAGRTYTVGSTGFWLNAFTETPQIVGCCEQGQTIAALNNIPTLVDMGITPRETALSIQYLQALGVQTIVVSGPDSTDEYKDFRKPERFAALPVLHRELGDTIYAIPQRSASLAHVIRRHEEISSSPGLALPDVSRYVQAIEDPRRAEASFRWVRGGEAELHARVNPGESISVQIPWLRGWRAEWNGKAAAIEKDGMGLIVVRPLATGEGRLRLWWTGLPDLPFAAAVSVYASALALIMLMRKQTRV